ncbi:hypothetical protein Tco_0857034 [Tanacetum coccineum]|uniref:Uncharacterized protein n=1 Tax=Tanacetum coccineum TaxID=301880 RepID=A0ABQ5B768_9ASTR
MRMLSSVHQDSLQLCHGKDPSNSLEEKRQLALLPEMTNCSLQSWSSQGMKSLYKKKHERKLIQLPITKQKPPTAPIEKKSGKGNLKTTELESISEADLTEAEQLKIITKRSRQETHSSHASGSEDDISWKSSDDDQDDEQAQDDEDADKNDVNETTQDDEDDDEHDIDEKAQDDDEEQSESDDDGDDFVHPKLITHDDDIIHEEETDEDDSLRSHNSYTLSYFFTDDER